MPDQHPVRALHLFSDRKFIPWARQTFSLTGWESSYIVLNPGRSKSMETLEAGTIEVSADEFGLGLIRDKLYHTDIAFHYFLDNIKADLIMQSDPRIIHCWCFYGAEIYQQTSLFRRDLYGAATRKLLWSLPEIKFRYDLRKYYFMFARFRQPPIKSLLRAIPRIHRILWYVEDEIEMINSRITLPRWQFFQFFSFSDIVPPATKLTDKTSKKILIGNSATIENNHVDVLEALLTLEDQQYTYSLPLTYGQFPRYKAKIKARYLKGLGDRVSFLDAHIKLDEYYDFLSQHPVAIFLHHRQQGLGNILYMLYTGTKVYLSRQNIVLQWLKKNQVKVYIFEDQFTADYQHQRLVLDDDDAAHNREAIRALLDHDRNRETLQSLETAILSNQQMIAK